MTDYACQRIVNRIDVEEWIRRHGPVNAILCILGLFLVAGLVTLVSGYVFLATKKLPTIDPVRH
jgi:hypothetical protein